MKYIALYLLMVWQTSAHAQLLPLPSAVYEYKMLPVNVENGTEIRPILDGPTETLDNFRVNHYTLSDGKSLSLKKGEEKLVLIGSGELSVNQGLESEKLESRSVAWLTKDQPASIHHSGTSPVSFFVIEWEAEQVGKDFKPEVNALTKYNYRQLEFKESAKGGRRDVSRGVTPTLQELEMHITTLDDGEKSHDPHVHADEEIILVLQGQVEEMINGVPYLLGPGSLIYLHAMDAHGIRNAGKGACEYYAIRWITKNTGK
ncbi:cupin domain-containing protein [Cyclobacterium sp. 1_MG-2023]|uniref:cupin domain-containing protein n=1 Tax=Cyclobacterium sp. 1_MG-2023 TaxID=3062681 RepID=UPI0026E118A9|nr:cupin domain-containing protein [Cyclobacterium sp. 1_MG-2023]MDO6439307.1 cupin domain-containing protein [Cyclobacterium sp. 1_MG-2023]